MLFSNKKTASTNLIITTILLSFFYTISFWGYTQEFANSISKSKWTQKTPDSLKEKTYKQLENYFIEHKSDSILSKIYAKSYLIKAKKENDSIKIADGYRLFVKIHNGDKSLAYMDSIILVSKNLKHKEYPGLGYLGKGVFYYDRKQYDKALKNYLISHQYAIDNKNILHQVAIKHNIAMLKKAVGGKKEAIHIFKENLEFIKTQDTIKEFFNSYLLTLKAIADSYHRMSMPDSARSYVKLGLQKSISQHSDQLYNNFLLMNGINNNLLGNHKQALDTLYKVSYRAGNIKENSNISIIYLQIAKALLKMNQNEKAIYYLKKIDSLISKKNYSPEEREAFDLLIHHYKEIGDIKNQLRVMSKLIEMDTIFHENNISLKHDIVKKYDNTILINERNSIIKDLQEKKKLSTTSIVILLIISISLIGFTINYYQKQKIYKKRFNELLQKKIELNDSPKIIVPSSEVDLTEEVVADILDKLSLFENKKLFLDPNIKMGFVAKKLKTNSTYLSKVINVYKGKNFANYINDLRIDYCIEKLKTDSKFRLYSIKSIGEEVGFNSVQSFSRAFNKRTELNPSYFIKKIEKQ